MTVSLNLRAITAARSSQRPTVERDTFRPRLIAAWEVPSRLSVSARSSFEGETRSRW
jgi:hypothetical protein